MKKYLYSPDEIKLSKKETTTIYENLKKQFSNRQTAVSSKAVIIPNSKSLIGEMQYIFCIIKQDVEDLRKNEVLKAFVASSDLETYIEVPESRYLDYSISKGGYNCL